MAFGDSFHWKLVVQLSVILSCIIFGITGYSPKAWTNVLTVIQRIGGSEIT